MYDWLNWVCILLIAQPIGQPEICKTSLSEGPVTGGQELFIIGKNFMKGTKVFFQEVQLEESNATVTWEKEADIDKDLFQPVSRLYLGACPIQFT